MTLLLLPFHYRCTNRLTIVCDLLRNRDVLHKDGNLKGIWIFLDIFEKTFSLLANYLAFC